MQYGTKMSGPRLLVEADSAIPPLTPCNPLRERYTPGYAACVAEAVLFAAAELRHTPKVTRAEAARMTGYAWALAEHAMVRSGAYVVHY